jgi:hypothetical protein
LVENVLKKPLRDGLSFRDLADFRCAGTPAFGEFEDGSDSILSFLGDGHATN